MAEKECPHCGELLSRQGYYTHKQLYFRNGIWKKKVNYFFNTNFVFIGKNQYENIDKAATFPK